MIRNHPRLTIATIVLVIVVVGLWAVDWAPFPTTTSNPSVQPIPYDGTTYVISLGREVTTEATAAPAVNMPSWSLQTMQWRTIHSLQGDLVVTRTGLFSFRFVQAEFSWWVSPEPFPNPLPDYHTLPPNTMMLGSEIVETWHSSILMHVNLNVGNVTLPYGWYITIVIDAGTPFTHAESEVSIIVS